METQTKKAIDRLIEFQQFHKGDIGGQGKFEAYIDVSNGYLTKSKSIGSDVLDKIHRKFPELNLTWLICGEGDMLIRNETKAKDKDDPPNSNVKYHSLIESQQQFITSQQQSINRLITELGRANDTIRDKQDIIDDFREQLKIKDAELMFIRKHSKETPSSSAAGGKEGRQAG